MHYKLNKNKSLALDNIENKPHILERAEKQVFLYLSMKLYNRIKLLAFRRNVGVSTMIREILQKEFKLDQPILERKWKKNTKLPC